MSCIVDTLKTIGKLQWILWTQWYFEIGCGEIYHIGTELLGIDDWFLAWLLRWYNASFCHVADPNVTWLDSQNKERGKRKRSFIHGNEYNWSLSEFLLTKQVIPWHLLGMILIWNIPLDNLNWNTRDACDRFVKSIETMPVKFYMKYQMSCHLYIAIKSADLSKMNHATNPT